MSELHIDRVHHRLRSPRALSGDELQAWAALQQALDVEALADQAGPDEWLLIRRLDVQSHWRLDQTPTDAAWTWSRAVQAAAQALIQIPHHPDVLRYSDRREALADLIYRSALGETTRQWAWQRMGWIDREALPASEVLQAGWRHLMQQPDWVWPLVTRWVAAEARTGALTALLHAVPAPQWQALLFQAPVARPYVQAWQRLNADDAMFPASTDDGGPRTQGPVVMAASSALPLLAASLQRDLAARPTLALRHGDTLALLLAALSWPEQGSGQAVVCSRLRQARQTVSALGAAWRAPTSRHPEAGGAHRSPSSSDARTSSSAPDTRMDTRADTHPAESTPETVRDTLLPDAPALPEASHWQATDWAGALFWLRALQAPGVLAELLGPTDGQHASDSTDPVGHALLALGLALGVPPGDAALRAFVGGHWPEGAAQAGVAEAAQALVARWSAWLDEAAPDLPAPRLRAVCQREGRLRFEPGWIELHLPIDAVDTRVRRLGLDLDPGHLPFLGCVVRIRYD